MLAGFYSFGMPIGAGFGMNFLTWGLAWTGGESAWGAYIIPGIIFFISFVVVATCFRWRPEEMGKFPDNMPPERPDESMQARMERMKQLQKENPWTLKRVLTTKESYLFSISNGSLMFCATGIMTQVAPILFAQDVAFAMQWIGIIFTLISVVACFGSWLLGVVDQYYGTKLALQISHVVMLLSAVLLLIPNIPSTLCGLALMAIFLGGASNFGMSGLATYWKRSGYAKAGFGIGIISSAYTQIGPAAIAWVAVWVGNYSGSFIMIAILAVISFILITLFDENNLRRKEVMWIGHEVTE
jgi:MFS-type transporter involved in bile tolerance (Atg22 family)